MSTTETTSNNKFPAMDREPNSVLASPVCVHIGRTNVDAHLKAILLNEAGISAHAVDDISNAGYFALGAIGLIHRPQVYVDRSQLERAREFLARYEDSRPRETLAAFCFHCGLPLLEDPSPRFCPHCHGQLQEAPDSLQVPTADVLHRTRTAFRFTQRFWAIAWLTLAIPTLLVGIYAIWILFSAPFFW